MAAVLEVLSRGLPLEPLPPPCKRDEALSHAPVRSHSLTAPEQRLAVQNALRYFPPSTHRSLAPEFASELSEYGHIYMYRFLPQFPVRAYPLRDFPARNQHAAAIMLMILNNLDPEVAQYPQELVTYGGNGQVFSNWAQFWLTMQYLSQMSEEQTLVMCSGHPLGLFPSSAAAPRAVLTNGMVIPNYSSRQNYDNMFALGVTMFGQMTAGSYCYIGPQGIVHGTTITVLNAGRKYLGTQDLAGKVFVTSGLGGMSGAQPKAAVIAGCICVVAEVSLQALQKRQAQGWLHKMEPDLDRVIQRIREAKRTKEAVSIGYHGNVVSLWERLVEEKEKTGELLVDLGSDQTSCHNPYNGGYYPVQLEYGEAQETLQTSLDLTLRDAVLAMEPERFRSLVQASLVRQVAAINKLADSGMSFWDYGNAFLLEARRAGADVGVQGDATGLNFRYPSYVQDIMGDIFSLGFGPFRWVCTSGSPDDLHVTDQLAVRIMEDILAEGVPPVVEAQYRDNLRWIREAGQHHLVVGSQARILYSDRVGRTRLALAFNSSVRDGTLQAPVVISRDHHDVSGTDSPYRETSNITDGSAFTADMAVQNCIGDSFRGATWVALHNGGGVGWGEVVNGGFSLVLDGTEAAARKAALMLSWDVSNGVARRCWSGNKKALLATKIAMEEVALLRVTLPHEVEDEEVLKNLLPH